MHLNSSCLYRHPEIIRLTGGQEEQAIRTGEACVPAIPLISDLHPHQSVCGGGGTPAGVSPTSLTSGVFGPEGEDQRRSSSDVKTRTLKNRWWFT
ncbi:hypothetical protein KOW79_014303 [Hemibagrus wyckioides]|uniref:Uncharacterized protein n=1 Tax=Hemibagrus wyckioides TaxID=337641 RepID=A0A9D3SG27_9TELE|nr:hypothetical protein KOW79_014303 [Hemibagrus wyckioides]